jgi:hypothetical protein
MIKFDKSEYSIKMRRSNRMQASILYSRRFFYTMLMAALFLSLAACRPTQDLTDSLNQETLETLENVPPEAVQIVVNKLSQDAGISINQIQIMDFEQVEWADACLEVPQTGQECVQVITPGFRVVLEVDGQEYEFHSNEDGTVIVQAAP